jgi:hypothetical protein
MSIKNTTMCHGLPARECTARMAVLLEKEIELIRRGNCAGRQFEIISRQAEQLAETIVKEGFLKSDRMKNQKEQLLRLYNRLYLAVTSQRTDTLNKLQQLRKGKKTIGAYRNNI